eukprot:UN02194
MRVERLLNKVDPNFVLSEGIREQHTAFKILTRKLKTTILQMSKDYSGNEEFGSMHILDPFPKILFDKDKRFDSLTKLMNNTCLEPVRRGLNYHDVLYKEGSKFKVVYCGELVMAWDFVQ